MTRQAVAGRSVNGSPAIIEASSITQAPLSGEWCLPGRSRTVWKVGADIGRACRPRSGPTSSRSGDRSVEQRLQHHEREPDDADHDGVHEGAADGEAGQPGAGEPVRGQEPDPGPLGETERRVDLY